MGDFLSPNKKDVFDRLRRRIELYRRHQNGCIGRYEPNASGLQDQLRRDTNSLRQKWLDSKLKKQPRSRSRSENNSGDQRQGNTAKPKRKHESTESSQNPTIDTKVHVEEQSKAKVGKPAEGSTLSVSIVQQISTNQDPQTIRTELTVNTGGSHHSAGQPGTGNAGQVDPGHVECKAEPPEEAQCSESSNSSHTSLPDNPFEGLGEIHPEELKNLLDAYPDDDIWKELDKLAGDEETVDTLGDTLSATDKKDKVDFIHSSARQMDVFPEPAEKQAPAVYDGLNSQAGNPSAGQVYGAPNHTGHGMGDMGGPGVQSTPPYRQATPQPPPGHAQPPVRAMAASPLIGDTGPASETLKQMASKHQSQGYGPEASPTAGSTPGLPGFPGPYPGVPGQSDNMPYPYVQQGAMGALGDRPALPMPHQAQMDAKGMGMGYGGTKPLSHYSAPDATSASSLQQLQNQVHSQFGPESAQGQGRVSQAAQSQQLQITQTQHMHVSHGDQHMQMSQTQQMHINGRPGQQISLAQQQTFSVAQDGSLPREGAGYMNDSRKMQLMQGRQGSQPGQMGGMEGYMNRPPPPEYQQHRVYPVVSAAANPLQTMQNMVNQTSSPMGHDSVAAGKAEYPRGPHGRLMGSHTNGTMHSSMPGYPGGTQPHRFPPYRHQGDPMVAQNAYPVSVQSRVSKNSTPPYKSAIMRGQRPPNVNVGPEGLNISHQGPQGVEWQRHMMGQMGQMSPRPQGPMPSPMDQMARQPMPHAGPMGHYGAYSNQGGMVMTQGGAMHMAQQQAMHMQQGQPQVSQQVNPHTRSAMMMMQQQRMQMQGPHQMGGGMAMGQSAAGMTSMAGPQVPPNAPNGNYAMNPGAGGSYGMDFVENPQGPGQDMFDPMVQNPGSAEFNLIDEILK